MGGLIAENRRRVMPFGQSYPLGAMAGGWLTVSCAHGVRLQAVTIVSPFGRETPPAAADKTSKHFCPVPMAEAVERRL